MPITVGAFTRFCWRFSTDVSFRLGLLHGFSYYVVYDMMHYAIHHAQEPVPLLRRIRAHHLAHHFRDTRRGFGVSSPFWDWVFRS
jgi:sterol desaturase/sphingolipid hydroxylase (fatty acid hydroxylase superfamily)